jgi:uncharacterized membrane protein
MKAKPIEGRILYGGPSRIADHGHAPRESGSGKGRSMSITPRTDSIIAVLNTHTEAQAIVRELQKVRFDMKKLSIVARDSHAEEHVVGCYNTSGKVRYWGDLDAFWGSFWGLLAGSAFLLVPGIGPIVVVGPVVSWIVAALEGATVWGGLSAVGAALYGLGIPQDRILTYESSLKANKFLVIAHGTTEEIDRACDILQGAKWGEAEVHRGGTPQAKLQMAGL